MLLVGDGVKKDGKKAFKLILEAAENGHVMSMHNVATIYFNGEIVEQDLVKAKYWLRLAAEGGDAEAGELVEELFGEVAECLVTQNENY